MLLKWRAFVFHRTSQSMLHRWSQRVRKTQGSQDFEELELSCKGQLHPQHVSSSTWEQRCWVSPPCPVWLLPAAHEDHYALGCFSEIAVRRLTCPPPLLREDCCPQNWGCCGPKHALANPVVNPIHTHPPKYAITPTCYCTFLSVTAPVSSLPTSFCHSMTATRSYMIIFMHYWLGILYWSSTEASNQLPLVHWHIIKERSLRSRHSRPEYQFEIFPLKVIPVFKYTNSWPKFKKYFNYCPMFLKNRANYLDFTFKLLS